MSTSLELWKNLAEEFYGVFGKGGEIFWAAAPGRVNLIGEHVDYHEGFVLPAAIDRHIRAVGRKRADTAVIIRSKTFEDTHEFLLDKPMNADKGWAVRAEGIIRTVLEGKAASGFEILMDADLSVGGGLSSSAASMAALGRLAAEFNGVELPPLPFARTLQAAEHRFAGLKCGIMDQLAVLCGLEDRALLLDCRSLEMKPVGIPPEWGIVLMDTAVKHDLASSEYNKRQFECAAVLSLMKNKRPQIQSLRDVSWEDLEAVKNEADPIGYRRCRHVLSENERVHKTVEALFAADAETTGRLFYASHESLRDDYEVSCRELDAMTEAALKAPGIIATRMTGGGFGGSVVNLVYKDKTEEFVEVVSAEYKKATGKSGIAIITKASQGVAFGELE